MNYQEQGAKNALKGQNGGAADFSKLVSPGKECQDLVNYGDRQLVGDRDQTAIGSPACPRSVNKAAKD